MMKYKKIYIEITNICNLNCTFCSKDTKPKREMTLKEFDQVLQKIDKYTDYIYLHVKGEPLIHTDFEEIIKLCNTYNKKVNITTNATYLKKHKETLKKVRQVNISLQSLKDTNQLKEIFDISEELSKTTYITYRVWAKTPLEKIILNEIDKRYNKKLPKNIFLSYGKEFIWPNLNNEIQRTKGSCKGTIDHIGILSDGTVIPCCLDSSGIIELGNIYKDNLSDIQNTKLYQNIHNGFKHNKLYCELCRKCNFYQPKKINTPSE